MTTPDIQIDFASAFLPERPISSGYMKRAWIRNSDAPAGQPAKGRINCPCGNAPESDYSESNGDVKCPCGTLYSWNGWIKEN